MEKQGSKKKKKRLKEWGKNLYCSVLTMLSDSSSPNSLNDNALTCLLARELGSDWTKKGSAKLVLEKMILDKTNHIALYCTSHFI